MEKTNYFDKSFYICETCQVTCPSGFDVSAKIAAITPVMQVPNEFLT